MHLSLLKKMHSNSSFLLIGYDTDYLETKLQELEYKPIAINVSLDTKVLSTKEHLSRFLEKNSLFDKTTKCIYASGLEGRNYLYNLLESKLSICGNNLSLLDKSGYIENFSRELRNCELKYPKTYSIQEGPLVSDKRYYPNAFYTKQHILTLLLNCHDWMDWVGLEDWTNISKG